MVSGLLDTFPPNFQIQRYSRIGKSVTLYCISQHLLFSALLPSPPSLAAPFGHSYPAPQPNDVPCMFLPGGYKEMSPILSDQ
jgi:hypothetical protein